MSERRKGSFRAPAQAYGERMEIMERDQKMETMRKKGWLCVGLGILVFLTLALEVVVLLAESAVYGAAPSALWQNCIHWTLTCAVWCAGLILVHKAARGRELFREEEKESLRPIQWIWLAVITAAGVLFMAANWNMTFKPLAEWSHFVEMFGSAGTVGFLFQYLYYLAESAIILTVIMLGQRAGELFFSQGRNTFIPWGWLFCSLLWGFPHLLTKNWETAVMSIVLSFVFELAYLAAGRKKWLSYAAVAVIFLM